MHRALPLLLASLPLWQDPQGSGRPAVEPPRYAVVIHADNKLAAVGDEAKTLIKRLFLKDLTRWPDGSEARVYARSGDSAPQQSFRRQLLAMSEAELARHWLKQKSTNGSTPPKEVESDRLVLKYVAKYPNALGVVELASLKDVTGVKVLFEF